MKKCTYCGRENGDDGAQCGGCGASLGPESTAAQASEGVPPKIERTVREKRILYGALWCAGGVLVTIITYISALERGGGTYIIAWGAILFGAFQLLRGLTNSGGEPSIEDVAYDTLQQATRLETQGRFQEALAIYQKIVES